MTVQRRIQLGFALMLLPVLLVAAEAIHTNTLERRAVEALGAGMARTRTYSELEGALQSQAEVLWRGLSGFDADARKEYRVADEVVDYWEARWRAVLRPDEMVLAERLTAVREKLNNTADKLLTLVEAGRRDQAWQLAQTDLRGNALPELTLVSRAIYGQLRESSVRAAFGRLEEILAAERRTLLAVLALALALGLVAS